MGIQQQSDFSAQAINIEALMSMLALVDAEENPPIHLVVVVVFMAFCMEAYVNSILSRTQKDWLEIERDPWRKKIDLLYSSAGATARWGEKPLQFAKQVFDIRDKLAHAKPETSGARDTAMKLGPEDLREPVYPAWYSQITRPWLLQATSKFTELMKTLGSLHGFDEHDHRKQATTRFMRDGKVVEGLGITRHISPDGTEAITKIRMEAPPRK